MSKFRHLAASSVFALGAAFVASAVADPLPKNISTTAYGTTSAGYAAMVAVGNAIADDGYKLRVLPAKNDVSRMTPLMRGKVEFSAMGVGSFQAQEGVLDFGKKQWGPQPVRLLLMGWSDTNNALPATAKDANIMKSSDLKGKRIAWIVGGPALNQNMQAWLAHGGMTWDDVTKVTVPGWKASIQGIIDGNIDAAIASTNSSMLFQVASSPRGLRFFEAPSSETENWANLRKEAPWLVPHVATSGVGLSDTVKHVGGTFGYPVFMTYARMSDQSAYEMVKLMHDKYGKYKDAHASAKGFAIDRQVFQWILPYHNGAIKHFKEQGKWTAADQAHNDSLLGRQDVLMKTWDASGKGADYKVWMKARYEALTAAGYDAVWED
ncbi:MAG: TAXI family TRAP transporter solute-binding subunit [Alphaproteobacteria bacterium]